MSQGLDYMLVYGNFSLGKEFSDSDFVSICSCLQKSLGSTDLYTFFKNIHKRLYMVGSPFLGHCNGGIVMETLKSFSELLGNTVNW